jgi:hypothetical protein
VEPVEFVVRLQDFFVFFDDSFERFEYTFQQNHYLLFVAGLSRYTTPTACLSARLMFIGYSPIIIFWQKSAID